MVGPGSSLRRGRKDYTRNLNSEESGGEGGSAPFVLLMELAQLSFKDREELKESERAHVSKGCEPIRCGPSSLIGLRQLESEKNEAIGRGGEKNEPKTRPDYSETSRGLLAYRAVLSEEKRRVTGQNKRTGVVSNSILRQPKRK